MPSIRAFYRIEFLYIFALVLACALAFGGALQLGFAPIDDFHLIVQNLAVRQMDLHSLQRVFTTYDPELYIPLTFLSFKTEATIVGMHAWGFHLDSLILHIASALLVAWIIARLSGSKIAGWCCAFLFAIHPLNTEAIVWLSARKDLLATFFALLSIASFLQSSDSKKKSWKISSIIFFLLALLSKISVVLLPIVLFVIVRKHQTTRQAFVRTAPFFVLSLILGIVALFGKTGALASTPFIDRMVLAGYAMSLSLWHMIIPIHLSLYYALPTMNATTVLIALLPLLLLALAFFLKRRSPLITLGILWFFVFILPTVLNIQTDIRASGVTFASDRYAYLPLIGLLIALSALLKKPYEKAVLTVAALVVVIFIPLAYAQVGTWKDAQSLFGHAVLTSPMSVQARISLAETLKKEDRLQDAFNILKDGLRYSDDERLHLEAGILYAAAGQVDQADTEFLKARSIDANSAESYYGLGALQEHAGNLDHAKTFYEKAIQLEPNYPQARVALAQLLEQAGDRVGEESQLRTVLHYDDSNLDAINALASLLQAEGENAEAITYQKQAALLSQTSS